MYLLAWKMEKLSTSHHKTKPAGCVSSIFKQNTRCSLANTVTNDNLPALIRETRVDQHRQVLTDRRRSDQQYAFYVDLYARSSPDKYPICLCLSIMKLRKNIVWISKERPVFQSHAHMTDILSWLPVRNPKSRRYALLRICINDLLDLKV